MSDKTEMTAVVIDDHPKMRNNMVRLLELNDNFKVVGEASNGKDALKVILDQRPDLVLLDLYKGGLNSKQTLELLKEHNIESTIVILTFSSDNDDVLSNKLSQIMAAKEPSSESNIIDLTKPN